MGIYIVRTVNGREFEVAEALYYITKREDYEIFSIVVLPNVKGFVFVEASSQDEVYFATRGLSYVKGVPRGETSLEELKKFLEVERREIEIKKGDIVVIISGALKGEKGRVIRIDKVKKEVTLEILEATIPLPITVPITDVQLVEKAKTK